jgi:hypothetical protein
MTDFLNPNHDTSSTPPAGGDLRHADMPKPLEEAADMLSSIAREPSEPLADSVKARQRAALLTQAAELKPSAVSSSPSPTPVMPPSPSPAKKPAHHSPWRGFAFGFAGVLAAAALILVFVSPYGFRSLPSANPIATALSIPAAVAADAFVLVADSSDASGVATDSSLTITSKVDVTPSVLKQSLRIEPSLDVDVTRAGNGTYKVSPTAPLEPGATYRISIETLVDQDDGTRLRREFSWALQAKNDMRVLSTIPRDGSGFVPTNTGIEFKLSRDGFTDATSSFSIVPQVEGRFDIRDRYLTFVPKMPLESGRRYEVTLKQGFGAGETDGGLGEDVVVRFETAAPSPSGPSAAQPLQFSVDEFREEPPNKTWSLTLGYAPLRDGTDAVRAEVIAYRVEPDEAKRLLENRLRVPTWAPVEAGRYEAYETANKNEAFRLEAETVVTNYQREVSMPAISPGLYAVRVTPLAAQGGKASWFFLQATDVAAYLIADKDRLYAWAVNPSTNRALPNMRLRVAGQDKRTDVNGLVELQTPEVLKRTDFEPGDVFPFEIIEYGDEGTDLRALGIVRRTYDGYWFDLGNRDAGVSKTWSYLYLDRPLYRTTDEVKVFGLAQDRETRQAVSEVEVRLRKQTYWLDWANGEEKIYQSQTVQTDGVGRFEASFRWNELSQGYYTIESRRGDEVLASRGFEVREFSKPAYAISVMMDREDVYDGDEIAGTVKAAFFEGTSMPGLRVRVNWDGGSTVVETDDAGMARFRVGYRMPECASARDNRAWCSPSTWLTVTAAPEQGEEGDTFGSASVVVHRSQAAMALEARADRLTATVDGSVWRQNLDADDRGRSEAWANRPVTLVIHGHHWEKIPNGFRYDFIEKKQVEIFRYQERWDPPATVELRSDARGNLRHEFPLDETRSYYVVAETRDDQGRVTQARTWVWQGSIGSGAPRPMPLEDGQEPAYPHLDLSPKPPEGGPYGYGIGDEVTATYRVGTQAIDTSNSPGVLYITGSRGIQNATVGGAEYKFRFEEAWMPNAELRAITWRDGKFETLQAGVEYRRADQALEIEATPRKERYAPGETVEVDVTARVKSSGSPARDTRLAYGAVDKALLALTYDTEADTLNSIYGYVSDGVIFTARTHDEAYDGFGGAEKGGGGFDRAALAAQVRKNFKDTAAFGTVMTDNDGRATIRFQAPDNVTGWRFELVGISPRLEAGSGRADVNVSRPVFVDVVAPPRLLASDQPFLKLRAFGAGLTGGQDVTFTVRAPTLGIDETVQGRAGEPVFVGIRNLVNGSHAVTVGLGSAAGADAIERQVTVVPSRFMQDEFVRVDLAPGSGLPDIGRPEATIQFVPQNRASLQPLAHELIRTWSSRSDALYASRYAATLLREEFNAGEDRWWGSWLPDDQDLARRLSDYQDEAGGIRLVSYGSADLELSAEVAATVPEFVDQNTLAGYFWTMLDDKSSSREGQIQALAGLAALGEPVLPSLQQAATSEGLNWRERLTIARGLEAAGDRERARGLLDALLETAERRDEVTRLVVSEREADVYEATADAAGLAARLAHPEAANLMRFVETNWVKDAFPVLAKTRYLKAVLPTRANRDITLKYTLGEGESVLTFANGAVQTLDLTAEEASRLRVTSVDGPIAMTFVRRTAGRPTSVPEVAISRRYDAGKPLADLREGDAVEITLVPEWQSRAQDGCYVVRDHLPGGWQAVVGWGAEQAYRLSDRSSNWYPLLVEDGTVSFVSCKSTGSQDRTIRYTARVVSRGSYTAEAPVIQHEQFPAVAAVGQDVTIEIK